MFTPIKTYNTKQDATVFAASNFEPQGISEQADRVFRRQCIDYLQ